jgi:hypothetical protein
LESGFFQVYVSTYYEYPARYRDLSFLNKLDLLKDANSVENAMIHEEIMKCFSAVIGVLVDSEMRAPYKYRVARTFQNYSNILTLFL